MILKKLTITNIASITSATIDFTSEPLSSAPVYLITGNTGAGKTTILDSICLALYATTPRLQRLAESGHKSIELADGSKFTDSRAMARRDSVEAWAILEFIGNDGITYTATWTTTRPYRKIDRPFRAPSHFLQFTENGQEFIIDKVSPLRERIEQAIGLDFKKFCRTTMLAQGDFTRFLQAPNDEKSEILEKITGTDIYRRISIKIRENYKARKDAANELEYQLSDTILLSEEELASAKEDMLALERSNVELKSLSEGLMSGIMWLENDSVMTQQLAELKQALADAETMIKSDRMSRQKELIAQYDLIEKPRLWSGEIARAQQEIEKSTHDIDELSAHALDLRGGLEYLRKNISENKAKSAELKALIDAEMPNSSIYASEQLITSKLQSLAAERTSLSRLSTELNALEKNIDSNLRKAVDKATLEAEVAKADQEKIGQSIEDFDAILEAKHPDRIRQVLDSLKDEKQKVERRQRIEQLQKEVSEGQQKLDVMIENLTELRLARDKAKGIYDRERESVDALIRKLRRELTQGCCCPLCRQTVVKLPVESDIELLIVGYEKSYIETDEKVKVSETAVNRLMATIEVTQKSIDSENTGLNEPLRSLEAIDSEIQSVEKLLEEINNLTVQIKNARQQLKTATERTDKCNRELTAASNRLNDANNALATMRGRTSAMNNAIEQLEKELTDLTESYKCSISPIDKPLEYAQALTKAAQSYNRAVDTLTELNRHIESNQELFSRNMVIIDSLGFQFDSPIIPIKLNNIDSEVSALSAKVAATRQTLTDAKAKIVRLKAQIESFLEENKLSEFILNNLLQIAPEEIDGARRDIAAAAENLVKAETALTEAEKRYAVHRQNKPEKYVDVPVDTLKEQKLKADEEIVETNRRIGVLTEKLNADAAARKIHSERLSLLAEKRNEEQRWKQLDELFGDTNGKKFVTIAQTYVLMDLIDSANKYMATLTDRYRLRVQPNSFIIYVDDAYDGGTSRPANTISGGESFLVSLALALALSDIAEGLQVDTLFIDEGFGTLSGQALKDAVATLMQLHSQTGRHVGIISHVDELREELPVQIQVVQSPQTTESHIKITRLGD